MNQGRHPGREATRRTNQQQQAKLPALVAFVHSRILPHLRQRVIAGIMQRQAERKRALESGSLPGELAAGELS